MAIVAKIGFRTYEFENRNDLNKARSLWAKPGSQDDFEDDMEKEGIDFCYAFFDEDI